MKIYYLLDENNKRIDTIIANNDSDLGKDIEYSVTKDTAVNYLNDLIEFEENKIYRKFGRNNE